jgi:VCBS repeat protein
LRLIQTLRPGSFLVSRILLSWAVLVTTPALLSAAWLFPNAEFGVGTEPGTAAIADFNGDGRQDVAVANTGSGDISVLLGNGDGSFAPEIRITVAGAPAVEQSAPSALAAGDFNLDGAKDLIVANCFPEKLVCVVLGNGDGTFLPPLPVAALGDVAALALGDFNGDQIQDLVTAGGDTGTISMLLGTGQGSQFVPTTTFAAGASPESIVTGDFDSDGRQDLAVANQWSSDVSVFLGNGDGTFGSQTRFQGPVAPVSVAIGDFNADGRLDLVTANQTLAEYGLGATVLLGRGDGTFDAGLSFETGDLPTSVAVGDFNADDRQDVVVTNSYSSDFSILLGQGDGILQPQKVLPTGQYPSSVIVGDFNADGRQDLAVSNSIRDASPVGGVPDPSPTGTLSVLLGSPQELFGMARFGVGGEPFASAQGDFNSDGRPDLAVANHRTEDVSILLGAGQGLFEQETRFSAGGGTLGSIAAGDFNADGIQDLAVSRTGDDGGTQPLPLISVLLGNGDGTFSPPLGFGNAGLAWSVTVGDFNADGKQDLAVGNPVRGSIDNILVFLGSGDGNFSSAIRTSVGNDPHALAVGDFNRDGQQDLAVGNSGGGGISVLLGRGDGLFTPQASLPFDARSVVVADFDADGRQDLVAAGGDTVEVFFGIGTGAFTFPLIFSGIGASASDLAVADLNDDERLDVMVNTASFDHAVFLSNGDRAFAFAGRFADGGTQSTVLGDYDGDGRIDVALVNSEGYPVDGSVVVLLNQQPLPNEPPVADAGPDVVLECSSLEGARAALDGSASSDPDSTSGTNDDIVKFEWFEDWGLPSARLLGEGAQLSATLPLGVHQITLRVTDKAGLTETDGLVVTIVDRTAPAFSVRLTPEILWPPNHRLVDITASVAASDACSSPSVVLFSIGSSEPDDAVGTGDGNTTGDVRGAEPGVPDFEFQLRAERDGNGAGRFYSITYTAIDGSGNATRATALVTIPDARVVGNDPLTMTAQETENGTVFSWAPLPGTVVYQVLRGNLSNLREERDFIDLGEMVCIQSSSPFTDTTSHEDAEFPDVGETFFYVASYDDGQDSSCGSATASKPRAVASGGCRIP